MTHLSKVPCYFLWIHNNPLWQCFFCSSFEAMRCIYLKTVKRKTAFEEKYSCQFIEISGCICCIHLQMFQHEVCEFLHYERFWLSRKESETMSNLMWLIHVSLPLSLYFQHGSEALWFGIILSKLCTRVFKSKSTKYFSWWFYLVHFPYLYFIYVQLSYFSV